MNKIENQIDNSGYRLLLEKQGRIYDEFRDLTDVKEKGLLPNMPKYLGGYLICWRHSSDVVEKVRRMSNQVNNRVKSIEYHDVLTTHTTITDLETGSDFVFNENKMALLVNVVKDIISEVKIPEIDYREWLMNRDTVIAAGMADYNFYLAGKLISESGKKYGLNLRMPWGSHITTARFLEKKRGEEVESLINLVSGAKPIGLSRMNKIEVVLAEHDIEKGLNFRVYEGFAVR